MLPPGGVAFFAGDEPKHQEEQQGSGEDAAKIQHNIADLPASAGYEQLNEFIADRDQQAEKQAGKQVTAGVGRMGADGEKEQHAKP